MAISYPWLDLKLVIERLCNLLEIKISNCISMHGWRKISKTTRLLGRSSSTSKITDGSNFTSFTKWVGATNVQIFEVLVSCFNQNFESTGKELYISSSSTSISFECFDKPAYLPSFCDFNYKIKLVDESKMVNIRPYKHYFL